MSTPSIPAPGGQAKPRFAGLLNMKFMQRAAASASKNDTSPANTTPDQPYTKRQRLNDSTPSSTPGTATPVHDSSFTDRTAISAALKAEEEGRSIARSNVLREGGETEWVLDLKIPKVNGHKRMNGNTSNGAMEEQEDDEESVWRSPDTVKGRQSYGGFKRRKVQPTPSSTPATQNGTPESSRESGEASEASSSADTSSKAASTIQKKRSRAPSVDSAREGRRLDNMNMSRMSGISGGATGQPSFKGSGGKRKDRQKELKKKRKTR